MGLFGIGKKKKMRGPGRSGAEKLNVEKARRERLHNQWLVNLRERGDPRFDDMMLQQLGAAPDTRDPVQALVKAKKTLTEAGMIPQEDTISRTLNQFAPLLQGLLPGGGQAAASHAGQPGLPTAPPGYVWALIPIGGTGQPAQQPEPRPGPPQPASTAVTTTEPPPQREVSPLSRQLIERFQNAAPEDAATAFLKAPAPLVGQLAQLLCETPDDRLDPLLAHLGVDNPALAGAFDWMRARPDWLHGFAVAIRKAKGSPAAVESGPASAA